MRAKSEGGEASRDQPRRRAEAIKLNEKQPTGQAVNDTSRDLAISSRGDAVKVATGRNTMSAASSSQRLRLTPARTSGKAAATH